MSNILLLHGPSQHETHKAYSLSKFLEDKTPHKFPALAELATIRHNTVINYFSFIRYPLGSASIRNFIPGTSGQVTISLASFLFGLIDQHDKVIILPCDEVVDNQSLVITIGYAIGKHKIAGSLCFPGYTLPAWYNPSLLKTVYSRGDLLNLVK